MKQLFSVAWKGSTQPRKQHKYRHEAPWHIKRKMLSVNLTKDLRKKYGKRNISIRKGDTVKIMTGEFKGKSGKINDVDYTNLHVNIEGIYRSKKDGTKVSVKIDPSNLQLIELDLTDDKRKKAIERSGKKGNEKTKQEKETKTHDKTTFKKLPQEKIA